MFLDENNHRPTNFPCDEHRRYSLPSFIVSVLKTWSRKSSLNSILGPPTPRVSLWKKFGSAMWDLRSWGEEEFVWNFLRPISLEIEGRKSTTNFAKISPDFSTLEIYGQTFTRISLWGTMGIIHFPCRQKRCCPHPDYSVKTHFLLQIDMEKVPMR